MNLVLHPETNPITETDNSDDGVACFSVHAQADAGVIGRVVDVFAKRGWVPISVHAIMIAAQTPLDGDEMVIDLQCRCQPVYHTDMPVTMERLVDSIAAKLRTLPLVGAVYASPRFRANI